MREIPKIIEDRITKGNCPICDKSLEAPDDPVQFEDYNGSKQPVHKKHIQNLGGIK